MPFSEKIKREVRRKAHYRCCICQAWDTEIHHIIPQEHGGPDTEENAAPLCGTCHNQYGGNPDKRKAIQETRDLWYEICEKRFMSGLVEASTLNRLKDDEVIELVKASVAARSVVAYCNGLIGLRIDNNTGYSIIIRQMNAIIILDGKMSSIPLMPSGECSPPGTEITPRCWVPLPPHTNAIWMPVIPSWVNSYNEIKIPNVQVTVEWKSPTSESFVFEVDAFGMGDHCHVGHNLKAFFERVRKMNLPLNAGLARFPFVPTK